MKIAFALVAAGLMAAGPAFAQGTAGGTTNTGPQGTGNFVAGKPEGTGNPVAGKPEGTGNPVSGKPGAPTGGAGTGASSTSSGDMGGTNASKK